MERLLRMPETTTPTQGATGPASVAKASKAGQPGGNPVNLPTLTKQEDSDEKKSGQSPHPFSPHGSPSSDRSNQRKDEPPWPISNSRMQSAG
jgi:hypothetical protein